MVMHTEDVLIQQTTTKYSEETLVWKSDYVYNKEDFGQSYMPRLMNVEVPV